jgi:hypothetical protein
MLPQFGDALSAEWRWPTVLDASTEKRTCLTSTEPSFACRAGGVRNTERGRGFLIRRIRQRLDHERHRHVPAVEVALSRAAANADDCFVSLNSDMRSLSVCQRRPPRVQGGRRADVRRVGQTIRDDVHLPARSERRKCKNWGADEYSSRQICSSEPVPHRNIQLLRLGGFNGRGSIASWR